MRCEWTEGKLMDGGRVGEFEIARLLTDLRCIKVARGETGKWRKSTSWS